MTIDESHRTSQHRGTVILRKMSGDIEMVHIKTREGLYEVAIKVSSDTANKAPNIKHKPWHKRFGHCGNETLLKLLV